MKKWSIIIWILIGIILLLAVMAILIPLILSGTLILKVFEMFFGALGTALQFIIVLCIVSAILFYIFKSSK